MINSFPITPPPELVNKWHQEYLDLYSSGDSISRSIYVATQAAQWGADQELEACCEWLENQTLCGHRELIPSLRRLRRPRPPSLKEQALIALDLLITGSLCSNTVTAESTIRAALEALND